MSFIGNSAKFFQTRRQYSFVLLILKTSRATYVLEQNVWYIGRMNFEGILIECGRRGVLDDRRFEGRHSLQYQDGLTTKLHKLHIKFVFF